MTCGHGKEPGAYCADCLVYALEAEIERLRSVLHRIPAYTSHNDTGPCTPADCAKCMALEALK
jgi:hypothetical protein